MPEVEGGRSSYVRSDHGRFGHGHRLDAREDGRHLDGHAPACGGTDGRPGSRRPAHGPRRRREPRARVHGRHADRRRGPAGCHRRCGSGHGVRNHVRQGHRDRPCTCPAHLDPGSVHQGRALHRSQLVHGLRDEARRRCEHPRPSRPQFRRPRASERHVLPGGLHCGARRRPCGLRVRRQHSAGRHERPHPCRRHDPRRGLCLAAPAHDEWP